MCLFFIFIFVGCPGGFYGSLLISHIVSLTYIHFFLAPEIWRPIPHGAAFSHWFHILWPVFLFFCQILVQLRRNGATTTSCSVSTTCRKSPMVTGSPLFHSMSIPSRTMCPWAWIVPIPLRWLAVPHPCHCWQHPWAVITSCRTGWKSCCYHSMHTFIVFCPILPPGVEWAPLKNRKLAHI
jgi:hypothetical protein